MPLVPVSGNKILSCIYLSLLKTITSSATNWKIFQSLPQGVNLGSNDAKNSSSYDYSYENGYYNMEQKLLFVCFINNSTWIILSFLIVK